MGVQYNFDAIVHGKNLLPVRQGGSSADHKLLENAGHVLQECLPSDLVTNWVGGTDRVCGAHSQTALLRAGESVSTCACTCEWSTCMGAGDKAISCIAAYHLSENAIQIALAGVWHSLAWMCTRFL